MTSVIGRRRVTPRRMAPRVDVVLKSRKSEYRSLLVAGPLVAGIVLGMAFGVGPLATASAVGALLVAIVAPYAGLAILAFMAPLVPPPTIPAPGFDSILVGTILLGCVYRLPIDRPHLRIRPPLLLLIGFVLYVTVQQLPEMLAGYASIDDHNVGFLFFQLLSGVGAVVAAGYLLNGRSPYPVLVMATAGAALVAVITLGAYGAASVALPLVNLVAPSPDIGRATGTFSNPNYLGTFAALMVVATVSLSMITRSPRTRILLVFTAVVLTVAVGLSLSRGAMVATLIGLAVLLVARSRALAVTFLGGGILAAVLIYPAFVQWRLENLLGSATPRAYVIMNQSDDSRLTGILAGPQLFLSSPIVGVGFGHFVPLSVTVSGSLTPINAHNWFLTVLAEQGLVGATLLVLMGVVLIAKLRTRPHAPRAVGYGVLGALAAGSLFLEPPTSFQMLASPAIILVAALIADWGSDRRNESGSTVATPTGSLATMGAG